MTGKDRIVAALGEEWEAIDAFLSALPEERWTAPTPLPGWSVRDVAAHVLGTEEALRGAPAPDMDIDPHTLDHVRNDIGALNEHWVTSMRGLTCAEFLERFRDVTSARLASLREMSQGEFDAPSWTPAGHADYGRFMQIRVFDCWMHEQDMRDGAGAPGHDSGLPAEVTIDEMALALGYIVGKRAGAGPGSVVCFELVGGVERRITVEVSDRARVVEAPVPERDPTTTLQLSSGLFCRLAGGRVPFQAHVGEVMISGDVELGRKVASSLAFTI